jgi:single-strand DNA-binding protein
MPSVNIFMVAGNLGQDPEVRYMPDKTCVTTMRVATDYTYKDKEGKLVTVTEWHRVMCYGAAAEACGKYLGKGSAIFAQGYMRTRKFQDKEGVDRYSHELVARRVDFLTPRKDRAGDAPAGVSQGDDMPPLAERDFAEGF